MHINSDRLTEILTPVERLHIESCTQCKIERQKLMVLRFSANQLDVVHPSNIIWQELSSKLPTVEKKQSKFKQFVFASAASFFIASMIWLMWSHNQLQQQFEDVLLANQLLELQLKQDKTPNFLQTKLLSEVWFIEDELSKTDSIKEQVKLLKKRELLIKGMLKQQGKIDEIFI